MTEKERDNRQPGREQDMEKEKIGKYIREKRTRLEMTQQQLADRIQVTEKAVSRWETGSCGRVPADSISNNFSCIKERRRVCSCD